MRLRELNTASADPVATDSLGTLGPAVKRRQLTLIIGHRWPYCTLDRVGRRNRDPEVELARLRARVAELERTTVERERAEDELRQLNANLSALLENTDDYILFSDREGKPLFFNSAYAAVMKMLLGIDMVPGIKPHELLPDAETRTQWDDYHRRALSGEKFKIQYEHAAPDGRSVVFEVRYNPVRIDGQIVGFSEFTTDITERELARRAMRESNERLERLVSERTAALRTTESRFRGLTEHSTDIISIFDRDQRFTYTAPSVRRYGFEPSDIVGRHASEVTHPDDYPLVEDAIARAIAAPGEPVYIEVFRVVDVAGDYIELEGQFTCLYDVQGIEGVVFNGRDVTERRQLEERLRHSEKMDAVGQLAGGIAHDFNNQLTGILAYADLLCRRLCDEPLAHYANQIVRSAMRSADLVRKLLEFAHRGPIHRKPTDVNEVVADLAELLERSLDERIALEVELSESACVTFGDPTQIHNAILNLALNARDAMPDGGTIAIRTSTVALDREESRCAFHVEPGRYVRVVVSDDGIGMDEETRQRAFEPFFTTKPMGKGTGMGLAMLYGTAHSHAGSVSLTSKPGAGTTVELYLPVCREEIVAPSPRPPTPAGPEGRTIVVVDDDDQVRRAVTDLLQELGHTVWACADGDEAVELHRKSWREVDLVILDMVMPRMSGDVTFRALREIDPDVRVLLTSGHTTDAKVKRLLEDGAQGFVRKPFDIDEISAAIYRVRGRVTDRAS